MTNSLKLPERIPYSDSASLVEKLREHIKSNNIMIDASEVLSISTFAAGILTNFKLFCEKEGKTVSIIMSDNMKQDLRTLGLNNIYRESETSE